MRAQVMQFILSLAVLAAGSLFLSIVHEWIAGHHRFSLPLMNMTLVFFIGAASFPFWGWLSTVAVLGLYGVWCVAGGIIARASPAAQEL